MPVYEYVALSPQGKQSKGRVEADTIRAARQKLRVQNIYPTDIKEALQASKQKTQDVKQLFRSDRVSTKELAIATRLLATLTNAGLPLVNALLALSEQVESPVLVRVIVDVKEKVEQGSTLHKALAAYPKVFPRLFINMVASGEASGTLDSVLENLADYQEAQLELRRKISSALFYPVLMLIFCVLVVIALVTFVVPSIVDIFIKQNLALPLVTQAVILFSNAITGYWWLLIMLGAVVVLGLRGYYRQEKGRARFDDLLFNLPIFGSVYRKVLAARISSTLSSLLNGGVELLAALDIASKVVGNVHVRKALENARDGVREGRSLSKELARTKYFPNLLSQMVAIGERSGKMESMLSRAGRAFTQEANAAIAGLTTLIEPLMLIFLGVVVLIIVVAVLLPMLDMMDTLQTGGL